MFSVFSAFSVLKHVTLLYAGLYAGKTFNTEGTEKSEGTEKTTLIDTFRLQPYDSI